MLIQNQCDHLDLDHYAGDQQSPENRHTPSCGVFLSSTCYQALSTPGLLQTFTLRKRSELPMTDTELKLIAAAAIIGDNSRPNTG